MKKGTAQDVGGYDCQWEKGHCLQNTKERVHLTEGDGLSEKKKEKKRKDIG